MNEMTKGISPEQLQMEGSRITEGVSRIIESARHTVAVYLNSEVSMTYWRIGAYIAGELDSIGDGRYGTKIVATVSRQLTWSHFVELAQMPEPTKRLFYQQLTIANHWSVRQLRTQEDSMAYERSLIAAKPEDEQVAALTDVTLGEISPELIIKSSYVVDFLGLKGGYSESNLEDAVVEQLERFIMELGPDFAFMERQKRISIDATDYYLDLLFYHRRLRRLFAVDLKLGKFKPEYKGQMELYLKYLSRYEKQPAEEEPVGLLLCSEGNTEHIELLMLGEQNIKVAQYLTVLPDKQWFIDKLNRSILIAKELQGDKNQ